MESLPCQPIVYACVLALSCVVHVASWAGPVLKRIQQTGQINIGTRDNSVPFSYVLQPEKKPIGYSLDVCHKLVEAIGKQLGNRGLKVNYVPVTGTTRIDTVTQGAVDLNCESTTNSAERRKKVAFSIPHYITGSRFLVRAGSPYQDLRDFDGKKIVSVVNSVPLAATAQALKTRDLKAILLEAPDHSGAIDMVVKGEVEGFIMDEVLLVAQLANRTDAEKFAIAGKYQSADALGIMMSNADPELKALVDAEIRRLIRTRELFAIHDRWFLKPIAPKGQALNLKMPHMLRDVWKYPSDWVPN
jgi:ABC-type amino acid transport substrate-binding protein